LDEDAVIHKNKKWFRQGNFDLTDQECNEMPKKVEELEQLLNENPYQTQQKLAKRLGITQSAIFIRFFSK